MEKVFNMFSIVGGIVGGFLSNLFGGYDVILSALIILVILDYVTGVLKAIYTKTLSSAIGFKGLIRKVVIFIVVVLVLIVVAVIIRAINNKRQRDLQRKKRNRRRR